jgi:hypothetical protein
MKSAMKRRWRALRLSLLVATAGVAGAQSGLEVTMRVVDDVRDLKAAQIVIGSDAVETRVDAEPAPPQ